MLSTDPDIDLDLLALAGVYAIIAGRVVLNQRNRRTCPGPDLGS